MVKHGLDLGLLHLVYAVVLAVDIRVHF